MHNKNKGFIQHTHECGYALQKIEWPEQYDVTSLSDIPEQMRGTSVPGAGWVGGVSFDRLPDQYHKFIQIGTYTLWLDSDGQPILECPQCHTNLETHRIGA